MSTSALSRISWTPTFDGPDLNRTDVNRTDVNRADVNRSDVNRTDVNRDDVNRPDLNRPDLNRADINRTDVNRGDFGRGDFGRGDIGRGDIDDQVVDVYHYAARHGAISPASLDTAAIELGLPVSEVLAAVMQLVELHLLRTDGVVGDRLVPMDPQFAATLLVSPIERTIYQHRDLADRLRARIETIARPRDGGTEPVGAIDGLEGVAELRGLLKLASDVCRDELLVLRPSCDDEETLDGIFEACYSVLDRGVRVRLICPHRSRAGFASRAKARRLVDGGAAIRTISHVPQASVVFDRSLAVMFSLPGDGALPSARRVRDENVVRFLIDMFDQLWEGAALFAADDTGYADDIADDLQRSIARLMAQGLTDEVVARKLGMSVRTCRRHIAGLLRHLDSVSRFQAGVQAAQRFTAEGALRA